MTITLDDELIDAIIAGIRKQVEWNGWEEPFVRDRFKSELLASQNASSAESSSRDEQARDDDA
jgi:hypothetical protein